VEGGGGGGIFPRDEPQPYLLFHSCVCRLGTSDFDAQMSGIKILKGDEIQRPVYKKPFCEKLSGCFHFGLFSSQKVHTGPTMRRKLLSLIRSNVI
jgi:hypothetical protein